MNTEDNTRRIGRYFQCLLYAISALVFVLSVGSANAKRIARPKVPPIVHQGVKYIVPNDNGRRAYVQAWDTNTNAPNKMLWEVTVFRNFINPLVEEDVQWVFIKKLSVEDDKLVVVAEKDAA